ncbi:hypothetical protein NVV30_22515 [Pseudomonas syringae]|uniref:hypothetical protein n=1 Tax=Pseudomonas syringae TaxID=317 RepID=UPI00215A8C9B|nr:hypothetical protein [Pseudomonas syringae]MCR8721454.1 hypothetical protein [Pseudomonas syringae]
MPSVDKLPPEKEVIKTIKKNALLLAKRIDFSGDHQDFETIIERTTSDPHDFFIELVSECELAGIYIVLSALKQSSISLWMQLNSSVIDRFIFELQNSSSIIPVNVMDKEDGSHSRFGVVGENLTYEIESKFDSFPSGQLKGKLIHSKEFEKIMLRLSD